MFKSKPFISHSGLQLDWKIDCDSLTEADLEHLYLNTGEKNMALKEICRRAVEEYHKKESKRLKK
jgi:hypothetical protein